jgi:hypothetical protein
VTEKMGVKTAMQAGLSDHQIRDLPAGSLRCLSTAQFPPVGGKPEGRRLRDPRPMSIARRRRGCGTVGNRSATRRRRAVFQATVGNRLRPAKGGRFSKVAVEGRREEHRDRPKAGAFPLAFHSHRQARQFHSPSWATGYRIREISSAVGRPFRIASELRMSAAPFRRPRLCAWLC